MRARRRCVQRGLGRIKPKRRTVAFRSQAPTEWCSNGDFNVTSPDCTIRPGGRLFIGDSGSEPSPARCMEPTLKKIVLAGILLVPGSASSYAADLPERTYTKASVAEAAYNWSGFYVGANAGYVFKQRWLTTRPTTKLRTT